MKALLALGVLTLVAMGAGCDNSWTGYYYPDANNLDIHTTSNPLPSVQACRDWVATQRKSFSHPTDGNGDPQKDDYECTRHCKDRGGLNVCGEIAE